MQVLTTAPRPASPQDDCKAAWLTKAQALHALGRHTEALADMQALSQTFGNDAQVSHARRSEHLHASALTGLWQRRAGEPRAAAGVVRGAQGEASRLLRATQGVPSKNSVIAYHRLVMATHHRYEYALRIH